MIITVICDRLKAGLQTAQTTQLTDTLVETAIKQREFLSCLEC
jgi:hypothetical protein